MGIGLYEHLRPLFTQNCELAIIVEKFINNLRFEIGFVSPVRDLLSCFQIHRRLFNQTENAEFFKRRIGFDTVNLFERKRWAFEASANFWRNDRNQVGASSRWLPVQSTTAKRFSRLTRTQLRLLQAVPMIRRAARWLSRFYFSFLAFAIS